MIEEISVDLKTEFSVRSESLTSGKLNEFLLETLSQEFVPMEEIFICNGKQKKIITATINGQKTMFFIANITYLGNPHPGFKKRIQIKEWWLSIYAEYKDEYDIKMMGLYSYKENKIFVDYGIEKYVTNKGHNSSAHVLTHDLYQAMKYDVFEKIDVRGNHISVVRKKYLNQYLEGNIESNNDEILRYFSKFNEEFSFNNWKIGTEVYKEMYDAKYNNALQSEWPAFYLEYAMNEFLKKNNPVVLNMYSGKKGDTLDFDLYSEKYGFFLDLKCSDISKKQTILNDQVNIDLAIEKYGKVWFVMYQHETRKDKDYNYETCTFWNELKIASGKKNVKHKSYRSRMKHSVRFKNMIILEVNEHNSKQILKEFKQGKNSNGKDRKPKYMVNKTNIDSCIIFNYKGGI